MQQLIIVGRRILLRMDDVPNAEEIYKEAKMAWDDAGEHWVYGYYVTFGPCDWEARRMSLMLMTMDRPNDRFYVAAPEKDIDEAVTKVMKANPHLEIGPMRGRNQGLMNSDSQHPFFARVLQINHI